MLALAPPLPDAQRHLDLAAEIVAAFVSNNSVPAGELPDLLRSVHATLTTIRTGPTAPFLQPEAPKPVVPVRKSVKDDFIVCLENGKRFKSLKRHLSAAYGLTPDQYRAKWGLPNDYPMVAPAYATARSALARASGLGRKPNSAPAEASAATSASAPEPVVAAARLRHGRRRA